MVPWRRCPVALAVALGLSPPTAAWSQTVPVPPALALPPPPPTDGAPSGIALSDALAQASARAPDTLVALARQAQAESEVDVAGMLINPSVRVGVLTNPSRLQGGVVLTLPLFGQRGAAVRAAEAGVVSARWDLARARLDVRLATASAWLDLWLAERQTEISRDIAARRLRLLTIAQDRLTAGTAPQLDVLRARAEAARARADAAADALAVTGHARRLGAWLGRDPARSGDLRTGGEVPGSVAPPGLEALVARLDDHPALAGERARLTEARRRVELEERLRLPLVGIDVGVDEWGADSQLPPSLSAGLTVEVPVFHNHGALIRRAEAALATQGYTRSAARVRLEADLAAAYADYEGAALRARAEIEEVLPAAHQAADLAVEGYSVGRGDIQTVIATEQAFTDARLAAQQALAARALALVRLENAVGGSL